MKIKYFVAGILIAICVVPGSAAQLAARAAMTAPLLAPPLTASTGGAFSDPNVAPSLSIALPQRFVALDIGTHPLQRFRS